MAGAVRSLPWARILLLVRVVVRCVGDDVSKRDRDRLATLLRRSKGDPRNLSAADRREILDILRKVDLQKCGRELAKAGATRRLLRR